VNVAIFLGPSLDRAAAAKYFAATYFPPIRRGDLRRAVEGGARTVGIIDGEFGQSLAVSVLEIRAALDQGVKVLGASSMGALRAAECDVLGMKGVGWIYERYKDGTLMADDEVALLFDPQSGRAMSLPLVNVRWSIELAGIENGPSLLEIARAIPFSQRTTQALITGARGTPFEVAIHSLVQFMDKEPFRCDRKRLDALQLLECLSLSA
jgi:hypothetical protein